jgi:outer membrane protein OmpU
MNQRLLLSSTALVGAGILFAGTAPAQAQSPGPIKVTLGGYTEFGVQGATDNSLQSSGDRFQATGHDQGYSFYMDNEVHITAEGVSDRGITYGSYLEMEVGSGDSPSLQNGPGEQGDSAGNVYVDEVNLFFSGGFGRVELGRQDGVDDVMFVGAEDAQSGTGGIDGDTVNLVSNYHISFGDQTKATYFTPRIGGFQLGANFIPDANDDGGRDTNDFGPSAAAGINWVGAFSGVDLTLSATGLYSKNNGNASDPQTGGLTNDDHKDYVVGGLLGLGGLSFGATFGQNTDFNEATYWNAGLKYQFGAASASVGYAYNKMDNAQNQNLIAVSGDVGLMPGVTLKADVTYNDEDPDKSSGSSTGSTYAGVATIQLDY